MSMYEEAWSVIGHEWAVRLLSGQIAAGRTRHAYLFTGAPGLGKTTLAMRLAQAFNCIGGSPPCNKCRPCDLIGRGGHPDVLIVQPEGTSIKIEAIRDLQAALTLRPLEARFRVALILNANRLTDAAADALLKTLEEPPATARLLLTSESAEATLPTIVSRCQVITLRPVPTGEIASALSTHFHLSPVRVALLAQLSAGRPGWALAAAEGDSDAGQPSPLLAQRTQWLDDLLTLLRANRSGRMAYAESAAAHAEMLPPLLDVWQSWWRDVLLLTEGCQLNPVNADRMETLEGTAQAIGAIGARQALTAVRAAARQLSETNVNTRLALDVMLLQMPYL